MNMFLEFSIQKFFRLFDCLVVYGIYGSYNEFCNLIY